MSDDAAILKEIRNMLDESQKARQKKNGKSSNKTKNIVTPYGKYNPNDKKPMFANPLPKSTNSSSSPTKSLISYSTKKPDIKLSDLTKISIGLPYATTSLLTKDYVIKDKESLSNFNKIDTKINKKYDLFTKKVRNEQPSVITGKLTNHTDDFINSITNLSSTNKFDNFNSHEEVSLDSTGFEPSKSLPLTQKEKRMLAIERRKNQKLIKKISFNKNINSRPSTSSRPNTSNSTTSGPPTSSSLIKRSSSSSSVKRPSTVLDRDSLDYIKKYTSGIKLRNKYSRFCKDIIITDEDIRKSSLKSDAWMIKFIESIYNTCLLAFNSTKNDIGTINKDPNLTNILNDSKTQHRLRSYNGLSLGHFDSFPFVTIRYLTQKFSIFKMKHQIIVDILITIEYYLQKSERKNVINDVVNMDRNFFKYDGNRINVFSKFLSEEYDIDILALFLHSRNILQGFIGQNFSDLIKSQIWIDEEEQEEEERRKNRKIKSIKNNEDNLENHETLDENNNKTKIIVNKSKIKNNNDSNSLYRKQTLKAKDINLTAELDSENHLNNSSKFNFSDTFSSDIDLFSKTVNEEDFNHSDILHPKHSKFLLSNSKSSTHSLTLNSSHTLASSSTNNLKKLKESSENNKNLRKTNSFHNTTFSSSDNKESKQFTSFYNKIDHEIQNKQKILPIKLNTGYKFIDDLNLIEAPLVCFEYNQLGLILKQLLPLPDNINLNIKEKEKILQLRNYLIERLIDFCLKNLLVSISYSKNEKINIIKAGIPCSFLFSILCIEWKKINNEEKLILIKVTLNNLEKAKAISSDNNENKSIDEDNPDGILIGLTPSLRELNSIYDKNCEKKELIKDNLSRYETEYMKICSKISLTTKYINRLTKRWELNLIFDDELEKLSTLKTSLVELEKNKSDIQSLIKNENLKISRLETRTDSLWDDFMCTSFMKPIPAKKSLSNKGSSSNSSNISLPAWANYVEIILPKILNFNRKKHIETKLAISQAFELSKKMESEDIKNEVKHIDNNNISSPSSLNQQITLTIPTDRIIKTISRIVVKNSIDSACRRILLYNFIEKNNENLLIYYQDPETLEKIKKREELKELKRIEEIKQKLRVLLAPLVASDFSNSVIKKGKERAFLRVYNPYYYLELSDKDVIQNFDKYNQFILINQRNSLKYNLIMKRLIFNKILKFYYNIKLVELNSLKYTKSFYFYSIKSKYLTIKKLKNCTNLIVKTIKKYIFRNKLYIFINGQNELLVKSQEYYQNRLKKLKLKKYFQYFHKNLLNKKSFKIVNFNYYDKMFIISYYKWLNVYNQKLLIKKFNNKIIVKKIIKLQKLVRNFLFYKRKLYQKSLKCIQNFFIKVLEKRKNQFILNQNRLYSEYSTIISNKIYFNITKRNFYFIKNLYSKHYMLRNLIWKKLRNIKKKYFIQFIHYNNSLLNFYNLKSTIIQKRVRGIISRKYVLNYYSFIRNFVKLQSIIRRHSAYKKFEFHIYYYRLIKKIQKIVRGYLVRLRIKKLKFESLKVAAYNNNYEKLSYYLSIYNKNILYMKDPVENNTLLHIACSNAAKRTIKLLLKQEYRYQSIESKRHIAKEIEKRKNYLRLYQFNNNNEDSRFNYNNINDENNFKDLMEYGLEIRKYFNINEYNKNGYTPLHLLILSSSLNRDSLFPYLIDRGFDEDIHTMYKNKSTLLLSCEYNRYNIVKILLERGHDTNEPDEDLFTCLQHSCSHSNYSMTEILIQNEADVNLPGNKGISPLHEAVRVNNIDIVKLLLSSGSDPNYFTPFPTDEEIEISNNILHQNYLNSAGQLNKENKLDDTDLNNYEIEEDPDIFGHKIDSARVINLNNDFIGVNGGESPLMWACFYGFSEIAQVLLECDADPNQVDHAGRSAAHFAAMSNSLGCFQALRLADASFDLLDSKGNSCLHYAAQYNSVDFAIQLIYIGVYPSYQNDQGDQVSHIAARKNQVKLLEVLTHYDEHIGRVNYQHLTPLGVARMNNNIEAVKFLESQYRILEVDERSDLPNQDGKGGNNINNDICERNSSGEIWWDKQLDLLTKDWKMEYLPNGQRVYRNVVTNEVSDTPPSIPSSSYVEALAKKAQLPLVRVVQLVRQSDNHELTKHTYYKEYDTMKKEIVDLALYIKASIVINTCIRRKLAYIKVDLMRKQKNVKVRLTRFFVFYKKNFMKWRLKVKNEKILNIQRVYRGYIVRKNYFNNLYLEQRRHYASNVLRYKFWFEWKIYKRKLRNYELNLIKIPKTIDEWEDIVSLLRNPLRTVGVYQEFIFPKTKNLFFYRHLLTGSCTFEKPVKLIMHDNKKAIEDKEIQLYGATFDQNQLTIKLQALWRGYKIRTLYIYLEKAIDIMERVEDDYMKEPEKDINLYNYSLFCFTIKQDVEKSRKIFVEALRRMQYRGPDIAFVLYSYVIFSYFTEDEEFKDILSLLARAKEAELYRHAQLGLKKAQHIYRINIEKSTLKFNEPPSMDVNNYYPNRETFPYGKVYNLASSGFFHYNAQINSNAYNWEIYAICRFLVYNDYNNAFNAYMEAFRYDAINPSIKRRFYRMMKYFYSDKSNAEIDAIVIQRRAYLAKLENEREELRRRQMELSRKRIAAAKKIQNWYRFHMNRYNAKKFNQFMLSLKKRRK